MHRQVVIDAEGQALSLARFVDEAWRTRVPIQVLTDAAKLYVPSERPRTANVEVGNVVDLKQHALINRINGRGYIILRDGPIDGDRSSALFRLAGACKDSRFNPTEAFSVLDLADEVWGKFTGRPDRDKRLREIVERVYGES